MSCLPRLSLSPSESTRFGIHCLQAWETQSTGAPPSSPDRLSRDLASQGKLGSLLVQLTPLRTEKDSQRSGILD